MTTVYKVCLLGKEGAVKEIIVFSKGSPEDQTESPFSEKERAFIEAESIPVRFSHNEIYVDDSISVIKHKIIKAMQDPMSYHELYLFSHIRKANIYNTILSNVKSSLSIDEYKQLLVNLGATSDVLMSIDTNKKEYSTEDLVELDELLRDQTDFYKVSIGKRFRSSHNELFSANPYDMLATQSGGKLWTQLSTNPLESFENQLLLNNNGGKFLENTLFVCFAEDVLDYCVSNNIDGTWATSIYFPLLAKEDIYDMDSLTEKKRQLQTTTKKMSPAQNESIDILHDIYRERISELPFLTTGADVFSIILRPDFKHILPLDVIFKNVHATKTIPFIKYNPGPRRENIYRLYSETVTKYGTKIPFLPAKTIIKLAKETGRNRQISFSVESERGDFYIHIFTNGDISISGNNFREPMSLLDLTAAIDEIVNPMIDHMNDFLKKNGYELKRFERLDQSGLEIEYLHFVYRLRIQKDIDLKKYKKCFQAVFDIVESDIHKGADLRFKRVENYSSMNEEDAFIAGLFGNNHREEIIGQISKKYDLSLQEAGLRLVEFLRDHEQQQGRFIKTSMKIADSPGFIVLMKIEAYEDILLCELELDSSIADVYIEYIDTFTIYFDSLMRVIQDPKSTKTLAIKITKICTKEKAEKEVAKFDHVLTGIEASILYDIPEEIEEEAFPTRELSVPSSAFGDLEEYEDVDIEPDVLEYEEDIYNEHTRQSSLATLSSIEEDEEEEKEDKKETEEEEDIYNEPTRQSSLATLSSIEEDEEEEKKETEEKEETEGNSESSKRSSESSSNGLMYFGGAIGDSKLDGMVLKDGNNNIFLGKLKKKEPTVFLSEDDGKFSAYSKICQASSHRQPIILTPEEKEKIDTEDTKNGSKSYSHALEYGSDPSNKNFYICPRYWCLKTNAPISEKDALEGKCGKILPAGAKKVEPGHYVIEFNNAKQHRDKDGNYSENSPGFLEGKLHPKGVCMPCCFKKPWDSKSQIERRNECTIDQNPKENGEQGKQPKAKKITTKQETYIIDIRRYPIPQHRWGFLPISVQYFLQTDNSLAIHPDNNKYLREDKPVSTLLRYGVENSAKKSFIGCIADIYAYIGKREEVPTIEDMCQIISSSVSIDLFLKYHNGSLASIFRPKTYDIEEIDPKKYEGTSEFMDRLDQGNETHLDFIYDTIAAYESFVSFLTNPESYIDHTYLWDIVCSPNPRLFPTGLNLAILRIRNVDMTDDIELLCPTSVYSPVLFDSIKETIILIKHDEFFEPVYLFHSAIVEDKRTTKIQKTFKEGKSNIQEVLQIIRMSIESSCAPKSSLPPNSGMPKVYKFSKSLPAESLRLMLLKYKFVIKAQIINYHAKVVGLWVEANDRAIYVPCSPSSQLAELEKKFMDDDELWVPYKETVDLLRFVHDKSKGNILCRPALKIAEDGQIIGVLTETNQFIMISDPVDPVEFQEDDIPLIEDENYIIADKVFAQSKIEDPKRVETVKKIILETQFYGAFRTTVRILLNDPVHNSHKQQILKIIENRQIKNAVDLIETILHTLCDDFVTFKEFDEEVLMNLGEISDCFTGSEDKRFCAIKDGRNKLVLPKKHLVSRRPNKEIYFARMADELWRYKRIQLFMMNSKMYLNLTNTEYKINADEMLMLESLLTADYFKSLEPYEHGNTLITYETANPIMSQKYSNEINQNTQQAFVKKDVIQDDIQDRLGIECVMSSHPITGKKTTSEWKTFFSPKAVELDLHKTVKCSYYPIIYTYYEIHKTFLTVEQIKSMLISGYNRQYSIYYDKVLKILRKQGKRDMVDDIRRGRYDLVQAITMEAYFLTPLDLWVIASLHELPIVLFHQKKLKNLLDLENWVLLNKTKPNKYYFVRVPTEPDSPSNYLPQYSVIKPAISSSEMSGLFKKANPASTVSLSEYFEKILV